MVDEDPNWRVWMAAAQAGDARSYAVLLRVALPWLRRRARARWPYSSAADLEDMVQETLLAFHQNRHLYDPGRPLAPFLFGILKLRGADVRRRRQRHAGRETAIDEVPVTFSGLIMNETQESDSDHAVMLAAISKLSDRDRMVLELLKVQQLSLREAAVQTGMSIMALKVATFRATQRLKAAMKGARSDAN
jgi:RNA polymerase sigma-70 factor (ECF subfamily)